MLQLYLLLKKLDFKFNSTNDFKKELVKKIFGEKMNHSEVEHILEVDITAKNKYCKNCFRNHYKKHTRNTISHTTS